MERIEATIKSSLHSRPLESAEVAQLLKGRHGRRLARSFRHSEMNHLLDRWIEPRLSFCVKHILFVENGVVGLEGNVELKSPTLARVLRDCKTAVCFIATIGPAIDQAVKQANSKHNLTEAYLVDKIGSAAVEDVVDAFQRLMGAHAQKRHEGMTYRFSPGYCDWPLGEQKKLFSLVDTTRIGVSLSSSCLMTPRKTVSGIFGVLPPGHVPYNPCISCGKKQCTARRLRMRLT